MRRIIQLRGLIALLGSQVGLAELTQAQAFELVRVDASTVDRANSGPGRDRCVAPFRDGSTFSG